MTTVNLIREADMERIAHDGMRIYEEIKDEYDPKERGKFLIIDTERGQAYLGDTSAEALERARSALDRYSLSQSSALMPRKPWCNRSRLGSRGYDGGSVC